MPLEKVKAYCLEKKGTSSGYPFGEEVLVFKVLDKMFALLNETQISLKCDPELAYDLRREYPAVQPGYHLNKRHWNTVDLDGVPAEALLRMIDHSYALVKKSLKKADREKLD